MPNITQTQHSPAARQDWLDHLKGLGILLVVAGHFMEQYRLSNATVGATFYCIYLFHMALFCICSGLVAKWNPRKLVAQTLWLYLLFQIVMLLFRAVVLKENFAETGGLVAAVLLPWRHMWYLYALLFWQLSVPLLVKLRSLGLGGALAGLAVAVGLGLAGGAVDWPFALERVFAFYPFFAFGVLFAPTLSALARYAQQREPLRLGAGLALLVGYGLCFWAVLTERLNRGESAKLFHDVPYGDGYAPPDRALFYLIGFVSCVALVCLCANCKALAPLGRRTLPVYLLHLPILTALIECGVYEPLRGGATLPIVLFVVLLTAGAVQLLGNRVVGACFNQLAGIWYKTADPKRRQKPQPGQDKT